MDQGFGFFDWAQTALNVAGNIPEIGAAANGINASISLLRGNYTQAAMYGTAAALSVFVLGKHRPIYFSIYKVNLAKVEKSVEQMIRPL